MSHSKEIPGLTPAQQQAAYEADMPVHEALGFIYAFEDNGEKLRIAFVADETERCTSAVVVPTGVALELARKILQAVAQPYKHT